jgi:aldose sugar dehydrogenase
MRGQSLPSQTMRTWAVALVVLGAGAERGAGAALAPAFVGKVNLDAQYVTVSEATDIAFAEDGRAVVTTKSGTVAVRHSDGTVALVAYPFPPTLDTASEKGLLGVVADPNVAQNRAFYFYVSNGPTADKHRIYRAVLAAAGDSFSVDATPIVAASRGLGPGLEGPANHDGGGMVIAGGKLFVGVGDTGSNATPPVNKYGSCLNKGNGKVLRLNLDGTVPSDNPLVGLTSASGCETTTGPWTTAAPDPRVFIWGQRNPWRLWVDPRTSLVWVGDVGETTQEEIAVYSGNQSGGYPFVEGSMTWGTVDGQTCTTLTPSRPCTPPVFSYSHSVGTAVTGGLIVEGCGWTKVLGSPSYIFGDSSFGWVRLLPVNAARTGLSSTSAVDFASGSTPVSFRMGPDQSLYAVFYGDGAVHRFTPVDRTGADCAAPAPAPAQSPLATSALVALLLIAGLSVIGRRVTRRHLI